MRAYEIIQKKRDGHKLSEIEIKFLVDGFVNGSVPDYQMAAFLMAVFFRHMDDEETFTLTNVMKNSGDIMDLSAIEGVKVDKHSTGGVGDKTTLILAPLVSSCGVKVAKLSGRGLGHTGGTIDKLESIPGFKTSMKRDQWIEQVNKIGVAIAGQTANLVPADKKIYALRDVTATVDEISLIASSIMSKKLAGGSDAFVLDVKVGSGAFMKSIEEASRLSKIMVSIAKLAGRKATAMITDMDQPLGCKIGNSLEVIEAVEILKNKGPSDLMELTVALASKMIEYGLSIDNEEAVVKVRDSIESGKALGKFEEFVEFQGGDSSFLKDPEKLLHGVKIYSLKSDVNGYMEGMNTEKIGIAAMILGAGRSKKDDEIDFSVGFDFSKKKGDSISVGEEILKVYYNDTNKLEASLEFLNESLIIGDSQPEKTTMIFDIIQ